MMMKNLKLYGTYTALATPFTENKYVDFDALSKLVEWQIQSGVEGLVVLGSTGESQTLDVAERFEVMLKVQEIVNGRIPIIVGAGINDTKATIQFVSQINQYNFDGVLIVAPYYNKPQQEGLYQHYLAISESVDIPIVMYNVPGRTGVNILPNTVARIAERCKNVIGIKEASGNVEQIMEVIHLTDDNFSVVSGDDCLTVPLVLMGAKGVIATIANYAPKMFGDAVRYALNGNIAEANKLHYELFELMNLNFIETNPVPVKAIMAELNIIPNAAVRLPLVALSDNNRQILCKALANRKNNLPK
jgi:4-hydroxy-tetrahydrodipicolinate synthase